MIHILYTGKYNDMGSGQIPVMYGKESVLKRGTPLAKIFVRVFEVNYTCNMSHVVCGYVHVNPIWNITYVIFYSI